MKEYVTCPSCKRYIDIDDVQGYCQSCNTITCSYCLRNCDECGKELCINCYGGHGLCNQCKNKSIIISGVGRARYGGGNLEKAIGIAEGAIGIHGYVKERDRIGRIRNKNYIARVGMKRYKEELKSKLKFASVFFIIFVGVMLAITTNGQPLVWYIPIAIVVLLIILIGKLPAPIQAITWFFKWIAAMVMVFVDIFKPIFSFLSDSTPQKPAFSSNSDDMSTGTKIALGIAIVLVIFGVYMILLGI